MQYYGIMTPQEKAKEYCQPILKDNHNKSYGFELYDIEDGFLAGYAEGFADASKVERIPSDDMIIKIINLYNSFGADKVDENYKVLSVETIKQHLYEN